jgi:hypothetical protein
VIEHRLRARRVEADQHTQVGQGVEQHVRLELRLEQLQLGFGGGALGCLRARFTRGDARA